MERARLAGTVEALGGDDRVGVVGRSGKGGASMFSHVTVGSRDPERVTAFYDAVLAPLGLKTRVVTPDGGPSHVPVASLAGSLACCRGCYGRRGSTRETAAALGAASNPVPVPPSPG